MAYRHERANRMIWIDGFLNGVCRHENIGDIHRFLNECFLLNGVMLTMNLSTQSWRLVKISKWRMSPIIMQQMECFSNDQHRQLSKWRMSP